MVSLTSTTCKLAEKLCVTNKNQTLRYCGILLYKKYLEEF